MQNRSIVTKKKKIKSYDKQVRKKQKQEKEIEKVKVKLT